MSVTDDERSRFKRDELRAAAGLMLSGQDAQDLADGHAVRQLREALPEGWAMQTHYTGGRHLCWVYPPNSTGVVIEEFEGDTLAEAADACRAAIEEGTKP